MAEPLMRVLAGLLPNSTMFLEFTRSVTSLLDQASPLNSGISHVIWPGGVVGVLAQVASPQVHEAREHGGSRGATDLDTVAPSMPVPYWM